MSNVDLHDLDIEDQKKVQNLIKKLTSKKQNKPKSKSKNKQSKSKIGTSANPRKISSKKPQQDRHSDGRKLTPEQQRVRDNEEGVGRTECRKESLNTGPRSNKFLESEDYNKHKKDTKLDKLLHQKIQEDGTVKINPIPERRESIEYVTIDCYKCGKSFVTTSNNVIQVGNEYKSECNRCSSVRE